MSNTIGSSFIIAGSIPPTQIGPIGPSGPLGPTGATGSTGGRGLTGITGIGVVLITKIDNDGVTVHLTNDIQLTLKGISGNTGSKTDTFYNILSATGPSSRGFDIRGGVDGLTSYFKPIKLVEGITVNKVGNDLVFGITGLNSTNKILGYPLLYGTTSSVEIKVLKGLSLNPVIEYIGITGSPVKILSGTVGRITNVLSNSLESGYNLPLSSIEGQAGSDTRTGPRNPVWTGNLLFNQYTNLNIIPSSGNTGIWFIDYLYNYALNNEGYLGSTFNGFTLSDLTRGITKYIQNIDNSSVVNFGTSFHPVFKNPYVQGSFFGGVPSQTLDDLEWPILTQFEHINSTYAGITGTNQIINIADFNILHFYYYTPNYPVNTINPQQADWFYHYGSCCYCNYFGDIEGNEYACLDYISRFTCTTGLNGTWSEEPCSARSGYGGCSNYGACCCAAGCVETDAYTCIYFGGRFFKETTCSSDTEDPCNPSATDES